MLNAKQVNFFALAVAVALFIYGMSSHQHGDFEAWHVAIFIAITASFFACAFNYWRLLKITEAPISSIAAAAQGYIELHGRASIEKPLKTPFIGTPCVWYRARVYVNTYNDSRSNEPTGTRLLEYVESDQIFQLNDGTGICHINPEGAEIIAIQKRTQMRNDHRYVEEYLPAGQYIHVLGHLNTLHNHMSIEAINHDMGLELTALKRNQSKLLARFDQNLDGEIDLHEWEKVRAEVRREVETRHQIKANNTAYTLSKPKNKQIFLISALSPQALRSSYQLWSALHLTLLTCLILAALLVRTPQ